LRNNAQSRKASARARRRPGFVSVEIGLQHFKLFVERRLARAFMVRYELLVRGSAPAPASVDPRKDEGSPA
jgi:hypothetical protein